MAKNRDSAEDDEWFAQIRGGPRPGDQPLPPDPWLDGPVSTPWGSSARGPANPPENLPANPPTNLPANPPANPPTNGQPNGPVNGPVAGAGSPPDPWGDQPLTDAEPWEDRPVAADDPWASRPTAADDPWAPRPVVPPRPLPAVQPPAPSVPRPAPTPSGLPPIPPPTPIPAGQPGEPEQPGQPGEREKAELSGPPSVGTPPPTGQPQTPPVRREPEPPAPPPGQSIGQSVGQSIGQPGGQHAGPPQSAPSGAVSPASGEQPVVPQPRGPQPPTPVPPAGRNDRQPSRQIAATPPRPVALDLSQSLLVRDRRTEPESGWRKLLYKASFGGINPGRSGDEIARDILIGRIRTPIRGCHKIAVVSLKGGIGKTTTTSCLGLTLAHYRGDRVVALDANPDAGTLAERLTGPPDVSVRDMLDDIDRIDSFTDISRYMSLAERLQVLASDQDPEVSEAFDSDQYTQVTDLLARYYNVILTDSGTGMLHSAMAGTLKAANSLVVVGAPSVDGSSRASKTLDWLNAHGHEDLVRNSVAVISSVRQKNESVDMTVLRNHFAARCRAVVEIPFDPHLVVGGRIDMTQIAKETERAYLELAAAVADGFVPDNLR